MTRVHLIRHGEVANPNHVVYADLEGFNLSPLGVRQVHSTASHLAQRPIEGVFTSPLARARQTATAIARRHHIEPKVAADLIETRQYPGWTGHRWDDLDTHFPGQVERYLEDASGLDDVTETLEAVADRVTRVVIDAAHGGLGEFAIVGHQDPLQAGRLRLTGRNLSELLVDPPSHASVVTIVSDDLVHWREVSVWRPF
jgi:broad specificity phosphatase PhoE